MTAPMDLTDDERAMWEHASKATTGKWYVAEYDDSIRSEVGSGNLEVGAHEFAGRDESHILASCPVNVLAALQKLSDARAALRHIRDHVDSLTLLSTGACAVAGAALAVADDPSLDAAPAPAPVAVLATPLMESLAKASAAVDAWPQDMKDMRELSLRAEDYFAQPQALETVAAAVERLPKADSADHLLAMPDPVQAAYAECARIARRREKLAWQHDGLYGVACREIAAEIEAAALRAGVKS